MQRLGVLEQNAHRRAAARRRHDRHGRRQPERARAGDDEYADCHVQCAGDLHVAADRADDDPHDERDERDEQDDGYEDRRDFIHRLFDGRLGRARVFDEFDDFGEDGIFPDLFRADFYDVALVDRRAGDGIPHADFDGKAFARDRRLINEGGAEYDLPVRGDTVPLLDDDDVAHAHLAHRNDGLLAVPLHSDRIGREFQELFHLFARLFLGARFQPLAERDEGQNHCGGLEKQVVHRKVCRPLAVRHADDKHDDEAVQIGRRRAEADERIHIRDALKRRLDAALKKGDIDE